MHSAAEVEPQVLKVVAQAHDVRYEFWIDAKLRYFQGHFPELALLPGVVQTQWAQLYARRHFQLPERLGYLANLKFMRIIQPNTRVHLHLHWDAAAEVEFEFRCEQELCSQGVLGWSAADE